MYILFSSAALPLPDEYYEQVKEKRSLKASFSKDGSLKKLNEVTVDTNFVAPVPNSVESMTDNPMYAVT